MTSKQSAELRRPAEAGGRRWPLAPSRPRAPARCTCVLLAGLVLAAGCGKKAPAVSAPPQTAAPSAAAAEQPAVQPDLPELNRSLMRWMMGHRRAPKDFEDFASTAGVTIPPPPAGKKYVIRKDMHIALVDR